MLLGETPSETQRFYRRLIAASLAQAAGVENVLNLKGGINAWANAGLPVVSLTGAVIGPNATASTAEVAHQGQAVFWNAECASNAR